MKRSPLRIALATIAALVLILATGFVLLGNHVYQKTSQLSSPTAAALGAQIPPERLKKIDEIAARHDAKADFFNIDSSRDGHSIPILSFTIGDDHNRDTAVLIHGLGGNKEGVAKMADMFLGFGYNVLAFDQMNHGFNTARVNTMGVKESDDALDVLSHANSSLSDDKKLTLWGMSFGGETAALATAKASPGMLDYVILDSPLLEGRDKVNRVLGKEIPESNPLFGLSVSSGEMMWQLRQGINYTDMDASVQLRNSEHKLPPMLVIESREDQVTRPHMTERLKADMGDRVHVQWTTGTHASASSLHTAQYHKWLADFLHKS